MTGFEPVGGLTPKIRNCTRANEPGGWQATEKPVVYPNEWVGRLADNNKISQ